jgi:hypothetical protein
MVDPATPPAVKVRAADSILNQTTKSIETENLEARLSELERSKRSRVATSPVYASTWAANWAILRPRIIRRPSIPSGELGAHEGFDGIQVPIRAAQCSGALQGDRVNG